MDDNEFIKLLKTSTFTEVGKLLGISANAVKKRAKGLNVYTPRKTYTGHNARFKKIKICNECQEEYRNKNGKSRFCSSLCSTVNQNKLKYQEYITRWKNDCESGIKGTVDISRYIRKYIFLKYNNKCCQCGWSEVNKFSGKSTLQVNHIDGNCLNNKEENLELLCPNCHSLTPTWGRLNKVAGRRALLSNKI